MASGMVIPSLVTKAISTGSVMAISPPIYGRRLSRAPSTPNSTAYFTPSNNNALVFNTATTNASNKRPTI